MLGHRVREELVGVLRGEEWTTASRMKFDRGVNWAPAFLAHLGDSLSLQIDQERESDEM